MNPNWKKRALLILLALSLSSTALSASAESKVVVINSADWEEVYSGIVFANLNGLPFDFLVSEKQASYQLNALQNFEQALLVESQSDPLIYNYQFNLETAGFSVEKLSLADDINLGLAELTGTKKFIILDSKYPHSAVSVVPYAALTGSYVLLADEDNIDAVHSFLSKRGAVELLVYGLVDQSVKEKLAKFRPVEINMGDKFSNNIELVKKYREIQPSQQITFTSGAFMEKQLMKGNQPILFTGETDIPETLVDYLEKSDIYIAEVVGNELTSSATKIKRLLAARGKQFYVFIRFGQGATLQGGGGTKKISSLDLFYLPAGELSLNVTNVSYNWATKQLEVEYSNSGEIGAYAKSTIRIVLDGTRVKTIGDVGAFFVPAKGRLTTSYALDLSEHEPLEKKERVAEILTQYGESSKALDNTLEGKYPFGLIGVEDKSAIDALKLTYSADLYKKLIPWSSEERAVRLKIKNLGNGTAYHQPAITFNKGGVDETYQKEETLSLKEGRKASVKFKVDFEGVDKKEKAKVDISYGARKDVLVKRLQKEMPLTPTYWTDLLILLAILLLLMLVLKRRFLQRTAVIHPRQHAGQSPPSFQAPSGWRQP